VWLDTAHVSPLCDHLIERQEAGVSAGGVVGGAGGLFSSALEGLQLQGREGEVGGVDALVFRADHGSQYSWKGKEEQKQHGKRRRGRASSSSRCCSSSSKGNGDSDGHCDGDGHCAGDGNCKRDGNYKGDGNCKGDGLCDGDGNCAGDGDATKRKSKVSQAHTTKTRGSSASCHAQEELDIEEEQEMDIEEDARVLAVGDIVCVASRMWPGQ
jgi:hypothetical protein